jgi:sporulation protein YlmC with PRC-barrel domain
MRKVFAVALAGALIPCAYAATTMSSAPNDAWTVTNYYKQPVYASDKSKIGDIDDVLLNGAGKVVGIVIGVGGFLGAGEKDVLVPFEAIIAEKKDNGFLLSLDETKDDLKNAPGFKYDRASQTWVPAQ